MLSIILQAGGSSTRMGEDKALMPFLGQPLVLRLQERFQGLGDELLIISNHPEGLQELGLTAHPDLIPDRGALGGLYTALSIASQPLVGLVAVDLPFADPGLMASLVQQLDLTSADAVIPSTERGLEPMFAAYSKDTALPLVKEALDRDRWKMTSWHSRAQITILDPISTRRLCPHEHCFLNVNTRDDFTRAEQIAGGLLD